eukprot:625678-Alexandrium_andersonii.AAC.1
MAQAAVSPGNRDPLRWAPAASGAACRRALLSTLPRRISSRPLSGTRFFSTRDWPRPRAQS